MAAPGADDQHTLAARRMVREKALQRRRGAAQLPAVAPRRIELVPEAGLRRPTGRKLPLAADFRQRRARDLAQLLGARVVIVALQLDAALGARRPQPPLDGIDGDA